jgi:hypothetical protein
MIKRRSFLKGLLATTTVVATPAAIAGLVKDKPNLNVDDNEWKIYSNIVIPFNNTITEINLLLSEMWRCITKGQIMDNDEASLIRKKLDVYLNYSSILENLVNEGKLKDWRILKEIDRLITPKLRTIPDLRIITYIVENDIIGADYAVKQSYDIQLYYQKNRIRDEYEPVCKEPAITVNDYLLGNVYMRYSNTEKALIHYKTAIKNSVHIKRFVKDIEDGKKIKLKPMSVIEREYKELNSIDLLKFYWL